MVVLNQNLGGDLVEQKLLSFLIKASKHDITSFNALSSWIDQWKALSEIPLGGLRFQNCNDQLIMIPNAYPFPPIEEDVVDGWHRVDSGWLFVDQSMVAHILSTEKMTLDEMDIWLRALSIPIKLYIMSHDNQQKADALYMRNYILDHISEMIAIKDKNMVFRYANQAAELGFKNELDTIVHKSVSQVYPDGEVQRIQMLDEQVYQADYPIKKTIKMLLSKTFIDAETERMVYKDQHGETSGILTINRNITDRVLIEEQLKKSLELQSILIKISLGFINVADQDVDKKLNEALKMVGEFIEADRVYVFEYDHDLYVTNNTYEWCYEGIEPMIDELQNISINEIYDEWYSPHSQNKIIYIKDVNALDHSSKIYQILAPQDIQSVLTIPLFEEENLMGFVGFDAVRQIRDWSDADQKLLQILAELIVHLKRNQRRSEELIHSRELAEKANQAKSIFLASMSHELRTPLSGLFNAINLIEETVTSEKQLEYINIAKVSIESFSTIINDILDLTRIEQQKMTMDDTFFNLENEMYQLVKMQEHAILEKNLQLIYEFDCRIHHKVKSDRIRLRQVILNLINNAIKFTDQGSIKLSVQLLDENDTQLTIKFEVADSGIGMDSEAIERLFEPFEKGTNSFIRNHSGAGLGLPIVKGILENYNTSLVVTSQPNHGSAFFFDIVLEKGEDVTLAYRELAHKKAWIVTRSETYQAMYDCFKSLYLEPIFKDIDLPIHFNDHVDYLIYMPGAIKINPEGVESVFTEAKSKNIHTILCVYPKFNFGNHLLPSADQIIEYPMSRDKFYKMLIHETNHMSKTALKQLKDLAVLVVDDNKVNRQALEAMLHHRGCHVTLADNGFQAIDLVKEVAIDVILMDIQMPGMDGYQTTKLIREMNYTMDELPIIAISANRFEGSMEEALKLGLNGYIMKPFKMDVLVSEIEKAMNPFHHVLTNELKSISAFDHDTFLELFNHNMSIAQKIIDGFINDYNQDIQHIHQAYDQHDEAKLRHHMHYFKGAAAYVTAHRIVHILDRCSMHIKAGRWEPVKLMIDALDEEVNIWKDAMKKALHDVVLY